MTNDYNVSLFANAQLTWHSASVTEDELLRFVGDTFRSAWPLELLLLLGQDATRTWPVEALVRELRASSATVTEGLVTLRRVGLVDVDEHEGYRFTPASPEAEQLARDLTDFYSRKPRAIMHAILLAPNERIQTFADAFRLRKDRE